MAHLVCSKKEQTINPNFCSDEEQEGSAYTESGKVQWDSVPSQPGYANQTVQPSREPLLSLGWMLWWKKWKKEGIWTADLHSPIILQDRLAWLLLGTWLLANHVLIIARLGFGSVLLTNLVWWPHTLIQSENWGKSGVHPREGHTPTCSPDSNFWEGQGYAMSPGFWGKARRSWETMVQVLDEVSDLG